MHELSIVATGWYYLTHLGDHSLLLLPFAAFGQIWSHVKCQQKEECP